MSEAFITCDNSKIRFLKFGNGKRLLIAFHGYGDKAELFLPLQGALQNDYMVYSIDLPFHGKTQWATDHFDRESIKKIIEEICKKEGQTEYSLMGYSFGGRIILSLVYAEQLPIQEIWLLAPDGIATKQMNLVNAIPIWFRRFLSRSLENPNPLFRLIKFLKTIRLLSPYSYAFTKHHLKTAERRQRLFGTWLSMEAFHQSIASLKQAIKQKNIPINIFFGKEDQIIPPEAGEKFSKDLTLVNCHLVEGGHRLVNEQLNHTLAKHIKKADK